ncbi:MAG: Hpt domain-containing protein, partial [Pseudomonadota bacterium]
MSGFGAEAFLDEAQDLLQALEEHLLELENGPDEEQVNAAFRALHTLKGSGEMFGFSALAAFVHHFESAFDEVRTGRRPVTRDLVAVALDSRDHIATLLSAGPGVTPAPDVAAAGDSLLARLVTPQPASDGAAASADTQDRPPSARAAATAPRSVTIRFRPEPGALRNGFRPDLLISELSELGTLSVTCSAEDVPPIETLDAAACYLVWSMVLETAASRDEIEDVFIFVSEGDLEIDDPRDTVPVEEEVAAPGDAAAPADAPAAPPAATATAEEAAPASDPAAAA